MADRSLPAHLAAIVEPLREADDYARLQHVRQGGFYNLVTGLPMFLYLLPVFLPRIAPPLGTPVLSVAFAAYLAFVAVHLGLFGVSCYPQMFMPFVRRHRPDWQSPLIEASLLKRALEKHFWVQFLFNLLYALVQTLVVVSGHLRGPGSAAKTLEGSPFLGPGTAAVLVLASLVLAWQARRLHDRWLQWSFLAMLPLAVVLAFLHSPSLGRVVFSFGLTAPPLILGLIRMLAPRWWLVR
jgi:uncharacterized membrane protein YhaH (DUF805 family)